MLPFLDSRDALDDATELRRRLDEHGYLFVSAVVPPEVVHRARTAVTEVLVDSGWVDPADPLKAVALPDAIPEKADGDPRYFSVYSKLQALQVVHEWAHRPELVELIQTIIGEEVLVHPRKIMRASIPGDRLFLTPPHQDFRLIQGTADVLTVWMPMGDCPDEIGGLRILAGSHRMGLLRVVTSPGVGGVTVDADLSDDDPAWRGQSLSAGDLLVFHSLTVHGARPNESTSLRLSVDFRYQALSEPVVAASLGPHYAGLVPEHDELTAGWSSTASVATPDGVTTVPFLDPFDPDMPTPPSRLVKLPSLSH